MELEVAVVIPTLNCRELLSRMLGTVLGQRRVPLKVLAMDDGSSDGTAQLIRSLRCKGFQLLRHEKDLGVSRARNSGLTRSFTAR